MTTGGGCIPHISNAPVARAARCHLRRGALSAISAPPRALDIIAPRTCRRTSPRHIAALPRLCL